jgi:hypothetical protein
MLVGALLIIPIILVYILELLRLSRKSSAWGGLSLMQQPVWKRLMWLALIWGGSVLAWRV